jgi:hypothetical protein
VANRIILLRAMLARIAGLPALNRMAEKLPAENKRYHGTKTIRIGFVQFDAAPKHIERNVSHVESIPQKSLSSGSRWMLFHENCLYENTSRVGEFAEEALERRLAGHG